MRALLNQVFLYIKNVGRVEIVLNQRDGAFKASFKIRTYF